MKLWPALVFACVLACVTGARAQTFPTRPITLVVPYAASGNVDVSTRILQGALGDSLGQPEIGRAHV